MGLSVHLPVHSLLVVLPGTGHLSEQLSLALWDCLVHAVQLKPPPIINYAFWTCRYKDTPTKTQLGDDVLGCDVLLSARGLLPQ